ncbi:MAG: Trm112 family protein [Candidatus Sumerlaeota bacterium]
MSLDPKLMEVLACPDCKSELVEKDDRIICQNADCRRVFKITDGIPVMLIDESEVLEPQQWREINA